MFNYSSSENIIPTLQFTKAELVYALSVLVAEIPANDNKTKLELVEMRHYLNQIVDRVERAASDGTLKRAMPPLDEEVHKDTPQTSKAAPMPSMSELRAQFPTLSDDEIREVIEKAREDAIKDEAAKRESPSLVPPPRSFVARREPDEAPRPPQKPLTKQEVKNRENSITFSNLLGQF